MGLPMYDYKKGEKKPVLKYFLSLGLLVLLLFLGKKIVKPYSSKLISPLPQESSEKSLTKEQLLSEIRSLIEGKGTYSIYIYDLNNKEGFGLGEETVFTAASVNKIPILASLYFLAGKGEIDLDKRISLQRKDIQDYGTGSIRYDPPGTQYSLKTLARLMMEKSDNTAGYILGEIIIGLEKIQELIDSWGLNQTDMENNKTSNHDMAILLSLMHQGKITNQALTKEMIGFMDDSDFEERLPKFLPKNIKVYHKIGNEEGIIHDAGIIDFYQNPYYLGVFSTDIPDQEEAQKIIAQISKLIFQFKGGRI